jgi:4,5-dihydroxyphthalate decarboxylase
MHHVMVMREELVEEHPWILEAIGNAFVEAKTVAQAREQRVSAPEPKSGQTTIETAELFGGDGWPYGIEKNRVSLEAFLETAREQGLTGRRYEIDEIFAAPLPEGLR